MKVILVGSRDDSKGGYHCLIELAKLLKDKYGYEIIVINPFKNGLNKKCDEYGIENYSLGYKEIICKCNGKIGPAFVVKYVLKYIRYLVCNLYALYKLKRLRIEGVDVVHSNTTAIDFGVKIAKKCGCPHVWHLREFGKEDFNFYYFRRNIGKYISDNSDKVIAISDVVMHSWVTKGVDECKVERIYDGVIANQFSANVCDQSEIIKIALSGTISASKGQETLIDAISSMAKSYKKQILVDFYGGGKGEYIDYLKNKVKDCELGNIVKFCGYVTDIHARLKEYNVGVVCSKSEGFGRVTAEYMLAGLCVVASDTGANPELLKNGELGALYKMGDAESLRIVLTRLIDSPDTIRSYAKKGQAYAAKNFDIEKNIEKFDKMYREVIKEN